MLWLPGKIIQQFYRPFCHPTVKTGIQKTPGFQVAPAIASLPGMTM
jgi:hypothetical protein